MTVVHCGLCIPFPVSRCSVYPSIRLMFIYNDMIDVHLYLHCTLYVSFLTPQFSFLPAHLFSTLSKTLFHAVCLISISSGMHGFYVFMYFPMRFVSVYHCTHCVCFPMTIRGYFLHMLYLFPTVRLYGCSVPVYVFHVYFPLYVCMAVQFQCTYFMCISHCTSVWLFSSTVRMLCVFPTVRLCGCSVLLCAL